MFSKIASMPLLLRWDKVVLFATSPMEVANAIKNGFKLVECWCIGGFQVDAAHPEFCLVCQHRRNTMTCWTCPGCVEMLEGDKDPG